MPSAEDSKDHKESVEEQLKGLLAKHNNDWAAVAGQLFKDNYDLREQRRNLRTELKTAQEQVPEGAVVLSGSDLETYEAWKALGDSPAKVAESLGELTSLRRDSQVSQLAAAHKLKPAAVKKLLAADAEIVVKGEGDKRQFAVKHGGKETSVDDLLKGDWKDFVPALKDAPVRYMGQAGVEDAGGGDDIVGAFINAHNKPAQSAS